jgi:hypothetical protein
MDDKLQIRALSRGVTTKFFNEQVTQRYGDNQLLLDACLIRDWDTQPEIIVKQNTFFFTLNNFMPIYEEKVKVRGKKDNLRTPWMVLHLKFKEQYVKDNKTGEMKPLGHRRVLINNIDININLFDVKKAFDGETFVYGDKYVTYNFTNSKEIRLEHVESEQMGINLIKKCLPFTEQSTLHEGSVEDNILTVNVPKNTPKVDTFGLRGYIWKVSFHEQKGKRATQVNRVLIANSARSKKK